VLSILKVVRVTRSEEDRDVMVYNPDNDMDIVLTDALFVLFLTCNLCSGAQLTTKRGCV
jgi:hypothetical protein